MSMVTKITECHMLPIFLFKHVEGRSLRWHSTKKIAVSSVQLVHLLPLNPLVLVVFTWDWVMTSSHSSIRFSLGRFTTQEDIDYAVEALTEGVKHIRDLSPIWKCTKKVLTWTIWSGTIHIKIKFKLQSIFTLKYFKIMAYSDKV